MSARSLTQFLFWASVGVSIANSWQTIQEASLISYGAALASAGAALVLNPVLRHL